MKNSLIKQAIYLPFLYFGTVFIASFFASEYSHIGQHASELSINNNKTAATIFSVGIFITGLSLILYGIGLLLKFKNQMAITSLLVIVFGTTFLFGAFFKIGSPWHGLYGIGLSIMLLPFVFLYEVGRQNTRSVTRLLAILTAVVIFLYFWAMVAGLDPMDQRGLTQRIFGLFVFGFISYTAYILDKRKIVKQSVNYF